MRVPLECGAHPVTTWCASRWGIVAQKKAVEGAQDAKKPAGKEAAGLVGCQRMSMKTGAFFCASSMEKEGGKGAC